MNNFQHNRLLLSIFAFCLALLYAGCGDDAVVGTCEDAVQNGDEEGVDCGGSCALACATCDDNIQNGDEEGVDCGGSCALACATCDDNIQNGDEEGVDCGGSCPFGCDDVFDADASTLAIFEFNDDVNDSSTNGRDGTLLGGDYVTTEFGKGLNLTVDDGATGMDWSAYASLITHPYTMEFVLVPSETEEYQRLFTNDDEEDNGWYYVDDGFVSYDNDVIGEGSFLPDVRHYLAIVSKPPLPDSTANLIDVYLNGTLIGTTAQGFEGVFESGSPVDAIFFQDDDGGSDENYIGIVDAVRISSGSRTVSEITAVQARLASRPLQQ